LNLAGGPISSCIDCSTVLGTNAIANAKGCGCISGWWDSLSF
jgi:hypothetical protein